MKVVSRFFLERRRRIRLSERLRLRRWIPGVVWDGDAHRFWGDSIVLREAVSLQRGAICEFYGFTRPRVRRDDEIRKATGSGTARLRVIQVEHPRDPPDMWFAKAEFVGWLEQAVDAPPVTRFSVFGGRLPDAVDAPTGGAR